MAFLRSKRVDPIDRAINDLDQQIASVQRQLREMSNDPARAGQPAPPSPGQTVTKFVKDMLATSRGTDGPTYRTREDLFDVNAEPLKELEAEPIAFARKPEPDLFTSPAPTMNGAITGNAALETAQVVPPQEKLAHYLGAGSIKTYKPLRRAQRQSRNRFFMWLGLSFFALWIIWFVIR